MYLVAVTWTYGKPGDAMTEFGSVHAQVVEAAKPEHVAAIDFELVRAVWKFVCPNESTGEELVHRLLEDVDGVVMTKMEELF